MDRSTDNRDRQARIHRGVTIALGILLVISWTALSYAIIQHSLRLGAYPIVVFYGLVIPTLAVLAFLRARQRAKANRAVLDALPDEEEVDPLDPLGQRRDRTVVRPAFAKQSAAARQAITALGETRRFPKPIPIDGPPSPPEAESDTTQPQIARAANDS